MGDLNWDRDFAKEQSGGDNELLKELMVLLVDSSNGDLEKIKNGIVSQDPEAVSGAAHSIKGAAASLGVEGLRIAANEIEKKGYSGQLQDIDISLLEDLVSQLPLLKA